MSEPAENPSTSPGEFTIGGVMAELNSEPEPEETEAAEAEAEPEKLKAESKSKPAAAPAKRTVENTKAEPGKLKEDFSDERPWTPERVKAAAAEAKELAASAQRQWMTEQKRAEKLKSQRDAYLQEKAQFRSLRDQFAADFQALRSGDPRTRLDALGRLAGADGAELFEQLTLEMARGGKKPELSPSEKALKAELDELKGYIRTREQQAQQAREERAQAQFIAQRKAQLAEVGSDAEQFPHLSEYDPEEIADALADLKTQVYTQRGKVISDAQAAAMLEQDLEQREAQRQQRRAERGGPRGSAGLEPRAASAAKPAQAQSSPPNRGRSLAPALSNQSITTRDLEEDETEDAADLIPASLLRAANPFG
jgi:hypothetical protein